MGTCLGRQVVRSHLAGALLAADDGLVGEEDVRAIGTVVHRGTQLCPADTSWPRHPYASISSQMASAPSVNERGCQMTAWCTLGLGRSPATPNIPRNRHARSLHGVGYPADPLRSRTCALRLRQAMSDRCPVDTPYFRLKLLKVGRSLGTPVSRNRIRRTSSTSSRSHAFLAAICPARKAATSCRHAASKSVSILGKKA